MLFHAVSTPLICCLVAVVVVAVKLQPAGQDLKLANFAVRLRGSRPNAGIVEYLWPGQGQWKPLCLHTFDYKVANTTCTQLGLSNASLIMAVEPRASFLDRLQDDDQDNGGEDEASSATIDELLCTGLETHLGQCDYRMAAWARGHCAKGQVQIFLACHRTMYELEPLMISTSALRMQLRISNPLSAKVAQKTMHVCHQDPINTIRLSKLACRGQRLHLKSIKVKRIRGAQEIHEASFLRVHSCPEQAQSFEQCIYLTDSPEIVSSECPGRKIFQVFCSSVKTSSQYPLGREPIDLVQFGENSSLSQKEGFVVLRKSPPVFLRPHGRKEADVICQKLGFRHASLRRVISNEPPLGCNTTVGHVMEDSRKRSLSMTAVVEDQDTCTDSLVWLSCSAGERPVVVTKANQKANRLGNLRFHRDLSWREGAMCVKTWNLVNSIVLCRQFGFVGASDYAVQFVDQETRRQQAQASGFTCRGTEQDISECEWDADNSDCLYGLRISHVQCYQARIGNYRSGGSWVGVLGFLAILSAIASCMIGRNAALWIKRRKDKNRRWRSFTPYVSVMPPHCKDRNVIRVLTKYGLPPNSQRQMKADFV